MSGDALLRFFNDEAITVTAKSSIVNLHKKGRTSKPMHLEIIVTEAFTASGAATLDLDLSCSDNSDHSSANDPVISLSYGKADLTLNKRIVVPVERFDGDYAAIDTAVDTGPMLTGKLFAHLVEDGRKTALNS